LAAERNADFFAVVKSLALTLAWLAGWTALALSMSGCTLTIHPDGSRSYAADAETIRIILEK